MSSSGWAARVFLPPAPTVRFGYAHRLARLPERFLAALIDLGVLVGIAVVVAVPFGLSAGATALVLPSAREFLEMLLGPLALLTYALWIFYLTYLEGTSGRSLGKAALGLRVVHLRSGAAPDMGRAFLRNLVRVLDWLPAGYVFGVLLASLSDRRQRLGDLLSETVVVHD